MYRRLLTALALVISTQVFAASDNGVITIASAHSVKETADRLESALKAKGMTLFKRVDHAAGAKSVGKSLRPTELVIFGNPKIGTPIMQCQQLAALDLPQKALIWQDAEGKVWYSYNNPKFMRSRHNVKGCDPVFRKVGQALGNFAKAATAK